MTEPKRDQDTPQPTDTPATAAVSANQSSDELSDEELGDLAGGVSTSYSFPPLVIQPDLYKPPSSSNG